ncbi:MAG: putative membrane protein [Cenarchaeum symbiont of Oopsacas minuta]|nr:putative membrane protein [Cenarchaeum symbiont of Oopsacas minuta]
MHSRLALNKTAILIRILLFFIAMAIFLGIFFTTAGFSVDAKDADKLVEEFSQMVMGLDGNGIFVHNATLASIMFIPGVGAIWGIISASATGYAFASLLQINPDLPFTPIGIFFTPFGILELIAYSIGISRSILLAKVLIKKSFLKRHIAYTIIEMCAMIIILYIAGHVEYNAITQLG